jgi:transposase
LPIRVDLGAIFVSIEPSRSKWLITSLSPGGGEEDVQVRCRGGRLGGLFERFEVLREKAMARTGQMFPTIVIQEAGLDGFWIHRALQAEAIENHVVDPASIATSRCARRAKTDKIDGEALVRAFLAYKRGEPRVCSMVRAPSPREEDRRRLLRERKALTTERVRHINRIKVLLFAWGVSGYEPVRLDRRARLEALRIGEGRELPSRPKTQLLREIDRLELLLSQIKILEAERDELPTSDQAAAPAATMMKLKGVGPEFGAALCLECPFRRFENRRQVAAHAGLAPTP